jgi:TonB family protein
MLSLIRNALFVVMLSGHAYADSVTALPESLITFERPAFPAELKNTSVLDGYATLALSIQPDGAIDDAVVLEASHVAFADAMLEVVPLWRFASAPEMLPRREVLRFEFKQQGVITTLSHRESSKAAFPNPMTPIRTVTTTQLTNAPQRVSQLKSHVNSMSVKNSGKVSVSYVIDTSGKVRVPVVLSSTSPELGLAAITMVKEWRFAPTVKDGVPVLVEDTRALTFR